jgi:hypothetical protein
MFFRFIVACFWLFSFMSLKGVGSLKYPLPNPIFVKGYTKQFLEPLKSKKIEPTLPSRFLASLLYAWSSLNYVFLVGSLHSPDLMCSLSQSR